MGEDAAQSRGELLESSYEPAVIEPKWQERWEALRVFEANRDPDRPKYFCYNPAPYITGSLHLGHARNYTYGDFVAKYMRLRGVNVLFTIGFDAFGLPTEMAAIRHAIAPERWTDECVRGMKRQFTALGCGFDWRRSFITSDPEYYRWTQWIFLQLLAADLLYSAEGTTQWCPQCETSLARAQVEEGRCWICASAVEKRIVREWRLRLSAFLPDLLRGLDELCDLNGLADRGQRDLIGRQSGFRVELELGLGGTRFVAFLRRNEDWLSACVVAVDARDEATLRLLPGEPAAHGDDEGLLEALRASFPDRKTPPDCRCTGVFATEVRTGRRLPVVVVHSMDSGFIDQPVVIAIEGRPRPEVPADSARAEFPALNVYRQKDFSVSRQRLWGTPIPIVICERCGEVPLPMEELPLRAPRIVVDPVTRRLTREPNDWDLHACPRCARSARLDPQVMDCHMDSLWHPFRPCASAAPDFLFDREEMRYWMPADIIQFGRDVIPFMLDLRFLSHFLHRLGDVPFTEFCRDVLAHGLIVHEGRKMSKHLGNVVTPEAVIGEYGADSLRLYLLAHAEPRSDFRWSQDGLRKFHANLAAFHDLVRAVSASDGVARQPASERLGKYTAIFLRRAVRELAFLETSVEDGRYDRYASSLVRLLEALGFFRDNHLAKEANVGFAAVWRDLVETSVLYLAPAAPHLAEECWQMLGHGESIFAGARLPAGRAAELEELIRTSRGTNP